ncbi:NAD(P)-binding protein [Hesseltinella vesiculosa]|uniref:NAD(P)-binding protein n=1 Tax=Hesseltinella vesiculosa TaxID=101127 RepID=A0A1X2G765_9FUNG|nr:NAD(P)-binding protein [Hesseltinella vesiculosa]
MLGKTVLITGGANGIGKAVAQSYRQRGANVVIGDIQDNQGKAVVDEMNEEAGKKVALYVHCDVRHYKDNIRLFCAADKAFGHVDFAFLNAGIGNTCNTIFAPLDDDRENRLIDVDLTAVVKGTKVALLHMAAHGGSIVVTASVCSFMTPPPFSVYNAAKHGVVGWVRSLNYMPAVCNVRINAICPAWIDTELLADFGKRGEEPYWKVVDVLPRASMKTLIEAVDQCVQDETKSGATLLVMPDGVKDHPQTAMFESMMDEVTLLAVDAYGPEMVARYKHELAVALREYESMKE